jgi:uncharacterized NAD(P)/FAD-binding protein YdhS
MRRICVVGAGPRGTSVLERIVANAGLLDEPIDVHLVDPYPPGGGRVWRADQSELLWMNSVAADVTTYPDDSVTCDGPIVTGPSLWEWIRDRAEAKRYGPGSFVSRRLQNAYLAWVFERILTSAPAHVRIQVHSTRALDLTDDGGRQLVWLEDRPEPLQVDQVVLAQGHLDAEPTAEEQELMAFAERHHLGYLPTGYTADLPLDTVPAGETVLVKGFGLAFVDYMVLLAEGRGGRFEQRGGELVYLPSGREPILAVGSGRGVPYRAKIGYPITSPPPKPTFFTVDALTGDDFWSDALPLIRKEIGWAYYRELFTARPERVTTTWGEFASRYAELDWESDELAVLVSASVPKPDDRLDFAALDRPLAGRTFADHAELQEWLRAHIRGDLERRSDPRYSADGAAFQALLVVYGTLAAALAAGRLSAGAQLDVEGWWHGFFSYVASGPPGPRLRELLALSEAGIVRFLGADLAVEADAERGVFRATSTSVPYPVEARWLVEARLPKPDVARTTDPLVSNLLARGEVAEQASTGKLPARPSDLRLLRLVGTPHPSRHAAGFWVAGATAAGAFPRPRLNAPFFRQNDALARAVLGLTSPDVAGPAG